MENYVQPIDRPVMESTICYFDIYFSIRLLYIVNIDCVMSILPRNPTILVRCQGQSRRKNRNSNKDPSTPSDYNMLANTIK